MDIVVDPATPERWDDVVAAFGRRAARPDSCWCQRFRRHEQPSNRLALQEEVRRARTPVGLVACVDGEPAGWTRVVPRHTLPGVQDNRAIRRLLPDDDPTAWWVTCFAVHEGHRREGVGVALLRAAVTFARDHGATVLDGHPVDTDRLRSTPAPSALFTGTRTMFLRAGFAEIGRTYPSRPLLRADLR